VEAVARIVEERGGDAPEVVYADEIKAVLGDEWTPQRIGMRMAALGFRRTEGLAANAAISSTSPCSSG
jgi:hypothetical protein